MITDNVLIENIDVDEPYINLYLYVYLNLSNNNLSHENQYESLQLTLLSEEFHHSIGDLKYALAKLLTFYYCNVDSANKKSRISKFSKAKISFWTKKEIENYCDNQSILDTSVDEFSPDDIIIKTTNNTNARRTDMSEKELFDYINNRMCFVNANASSNTNQIQLHTEEDFKIVSDELENWLTTEQIRIEQLIGINSKHMNRNGHEDRNEGNNTNVISLKLLFSPMAEMPTPIIRVAIISIKKIVDGIVLLNNITNKSYVQYNLVVRQCRLEWIISRRFSDFVKLHRSLLAQDPSESGAIPKELMPSLPSKYTNNKYVSCTDMVVNYRKKQLHAYLNSLLEFNRIEANHHLLRFLGLMNRSTGDESQTQNIDTESEMITAYNDAVTGELKCNTGRRPLIHISKLQGTVRWGDIILFRCVNNISSLQRKITGSNWDHVGLVVSKDSCGGYNNSNNFNVQDLYILESTAVGVTVFPLIPRLQAYHNTKFCEAIGLRCYYGLRTLEMYNNMLSFVNVVNGAPYGFKLSQILFTQEFHHHANSDDVGYADEVDMDACLPQCGAGGSGRELDEDGSKKSSLFSRIYDSIFGCTRVESVDETASIDRKSCSSSADAVGSVKSGELFVDTHGKICRNASDSSTESSDRLNLNAASSTDFPPSPPAPIPKSIPLVSKSQNSSTSSAVHSDGVNIDQDDSPKCEKKSEVHDPKNVTKNVPESPIGGASPNVSPDIPTGNSSNHNPLLISEMMNMEHRALGATATATASSSLETTVLPIEKPITTKQDSPSSIVDVPVKVNSSSSNAQSTGNSVVQPLKSVRNSKNSSVAGNTSKKRSNASAPTTYFCSELVAACLIAMCIIHESHNPAFFWPDSFAYNKYLDSCCVQHSDRNSIIMDDTHMNEINKYVANAEFTDDEEEDEAGDEDVSTNCIGYYGDELIIDCNVIEIAKAKTVNSYGYDKRELESSNMYNPSATFVPSL